MPLQHMLKPWALLLLVLTGLLGRPLVWAAPLPVTREQVTQAKTQVMADPNLASTRTVRSLQFKKSEADQPAKKETKPKRDTDFGLSWLFDFFRWVTESARMLMWVLGFAVLAWVLLRLRHWINMHADAPLAGPDTLPSQINDLDIRPQSLPPDVGASAAALWQRGEQRACL